MVCFSALVPNFIVGNSVIFGVMGSFFLFSGYLILKHRIEREIVPVKRIKFLFQISTDGECEEAPKM